MRRMRRQEEDEKARGEGGSRRKQEEDVKRVKAASFSDMIHRLSSKQSMIVL